MKRRALWVIGCIAVGAVVGGAMPAGAEDDGWLVEITPYFWGIGLDGQVGVNGLPPADVDMSFGDIWDDFENAVAVVFAAGNGPWVVAGDVSYLDTKTTEQLPQTRVTLDNESTIAKLVGGRSVSPGDWPCRVDVYAGARYYRFKTKLGMSGLGSRSHTEDWVDPLVGMNIVWPFAGKWRANLIADVGGFDVGSDLAWEVLPLVQYQFNPTWSAKAGYRWLDVDYEDDDYKSDVLTQGWMAGVGAAF